MIEIKKTSAEPMVVIRTATGSELSDYEKRKLANIEENAQENKIESIKVNNKRLPIDTANKEVNLEFGNLAFKNKVVLDDISQDRLIFIKCELDADDLGGI